MAHEVKAYQSASGRLFSTEEEAVYDETVVERERQMLKFLTKAYDYYSNPRDLTRYICDRRDEVVAILQPDVLGKKLNKEA